MWWFNDNVSGLETRLPFDNLIKVLKRNFKKILFIFLTESAATSTSAGGDDFDDFHLCRYKKKNVIRFEIEFYN